MIVLVVAVTVGWVVLTIIGAFREAENAPIYWALLSVGSVVLTTVLVGVVMHLTLSPSGARFLAVFPVAGSS